MFFMVAGEEAVRMVLIQSALEVLEEEEQAEAEFLILFLFLMELMD